MQHAFTTWLAGAAALVALTAGAQMPNPASPDTPNPADTAPAADAKSAAKSVQDRAPAGGLSDADAKFLRDAASIDMEEVEGGSLALDRGTDTQVTAFARTMVDDHSQNSEELRKLAEGNGITLPARAEGKQRSALKDLRGKSGAAFDQAYVKGNVKGHKEAIARFERAAKSAKNPEVRAYAKSTLPALKHHLQMAQQLQSALGGKR